MDNPSLAGMSPDEIRFALRRERSLLTAELAAAKAALRDAAADVERIEERLRQVEEGERIIGF